MGAGLDLFGQRRDGSEFPVEISLSPLETDEGKRVMAAVRDITDRKAIEERVRKSLQEKDVLLQEVHHRVKNNLQVVASLLNLQSQLLPDGAARDLFQDARNRVRSIALVHEKLYRSKDLAQLDFRQYLEGLVDELRRFYPQQSGVTIEVDAEPFPVSMDPAINAGLVLNELVSNCLKHAFPDGRRGKIQIRIRRDGPGVMAVTVKDDGIGLPGPFKPKEAKSMGSRLLASLVDQMGGTIQVLPGPGTTFDLRLNVGTSKEDPQ